MRERGVVVITESSWMRRFCAARKREGVPVAFVPTMGYLHDGHLRLVEKACELSPCVVVCIFVNPLQFGPAEDLDRYPRDLQGDLDKLSAFPVSAVFCPSREALYPDGFQTHVEVREVTRELCGSARPGHFTGVATVVLKLFQIVLPDYAVFGAKDYQQLVTIRTMVRDLNVPVEIVSCETVREPDGLAMSSRNVFLDAGQRSAAVILNRSLDEAGRRIDSGEFSNPVEVEQFVRERIQSEPLAKLDYVACRDAGTLASVERIAAPVVVALAVFFGNTRLIDNQVFSPGDHRDPKGVNS